MPTELLTLNQAIGLDVNRANELYKNHVSAGLLKAYTVLGFATMDIERAEGVEIHLRDGRTLLDFSSAIGVLALGHNHPRIVAAERLCHEQKLIDAFKVGPLKLQAALAHNLAQVLPGNLEVAFFTTSGAEAVEAALKLCEKAQGPSKTKYIAATSGFHGKTHGALSLTRVAGFQDGFLLGIPDTNVIEVPYGQVEAIEGAIKANQTGTGSENSIIAVILEAIQGEAVVEPPSGYLREVKELCAKHGVLVIFDEVKVGMGRTGTFCAFEADDVVPDVVTLSKALGGGKRAIGAMVTNRETFQRAYGKRKDWAAHSTTFGGLGESCAVAIETLNVYADDGLVEAARIKGIYLREKLLALKDKHKDKISEIRGRGLFQGIRFNFNQLPKLIASKALNGPQMKMFKTLDSLAMASVIRELAREHRIVTHFSGPDPDVLHLMPPLIIEERHIDYFADALDQVLAKGFLKLLAGLLKD